MENTSPPVVWLSSQQVANAFGVNPKTVQRWAKAGKLEFTRTLGGHRRYRKDQVLALLKGNR